jgi:hypothetical protein
MSSMPSVAQLAVVFGRELDTAVERAEADRALCCDVALDLGGGG